MRSPGRAALREAANGLLARPNVRACFLGKKRKAGKLTARWSLVCCVETKVSNNSLRPEHRVPARIRWIDPRQRQRDLATDVVEITTGFSYQQGTVAGPGDVIARANGSVATVGYALDHPVYGPVVTTAAHLFGTNNGTEAVTIHTGGESYPGVLVTPPRLTRRADYALIRPEGVPCDNRFLDLYGIYGVHRPTPNDLGKDLWILTGDGRMWPVRCAGLEGTLVLSDGRIVEDVMLTDLRTQGGDSGCCLVDDQSAIWGLLIGRYDTQYKSYSVFAQAYVPLFEENATFIYGRLL